MNTLHELYVKLAGSLQELEQLLSSPPKRNSHLHQRRLSSSGSLSSRHHFSSPYTLVSRAAYSLID